MRKKKAREINQQPKGAPDLGCDVCYRKKDGCAEAGPRKFCSRFLSAEFDAQKDGDPTEIWEENRKKKQTKAKEMKED